MTRNTSRKRFEKWASRHGLPLGRIQEVTRDGPRLTGYSNATTRLCWIAWEAQRRHFSAMAES